MNNTNNKTKIHHQKDQRIERMFLYRKKAIFTKFQQMKYNVIDNISCFINKKSKKESE